jgi:hypothetical protein
MASGSNASFTLQRRLRNAKIKAFDIIAQFKYGYRNREDQTNLPAGVLVTGSKNVLTNVSERVQCRRGYVLDGPVSATATNITSAYTFENHIGNEINLRTWGTVMEYRYVDANGVVSWNTLLSGLTSTAFNYTSWWFPLTSGGTAGEGANVILMANGTSNIYEWNGGVTTIASVGAGTLTKTGSVPWAVSFYSDNTQHPTRKVTVRGVDYTYTGGENTTTLTGVTPDPSVASPAIVAGDVVIQTPIITALSSMTAVEMPKVDLIETFNTQLFIGSLSNQLVQASKSWTISTGGTYTDFTTSDIAKSGYGHQLALDSSPVSFNALENILAISAGKNQWYEISIAQSTYTDDTNPSAPVVYDIDTWTVNRLKTTAQQAAQSQSMVSAMKNDLIFISNEPTLDRLGRVEQILGTTQTTNLSDPIKLDFDSYDFTDSNIYYNKYFIYISVPKSGLILIYNIVKSYWEAPQTIPVGRFYTVGGILYGHSYLTPESYQLFTGYADRVDPTTNPNGNPIPANVTFSYNNYGAPSVLKSFNEFYVEGYINAATDLTLGITYDINGCATKTSYIISGDNNKYVCIGSGSGTLDDADLGKNSLGKYPLGGNIDVTSILALAPKFRLIQTFPLTDFFECQISFTSIQTNSNWELLRLGPNLTYSSNIASNIYN